ncbi:MAG TPA: hypothetical protein VEY88_23820 [Archangium sp.]|nr:hypothetical protein [Archangium sp.]
MENKPDCKRGSVIECQNQVLGESLPLTGTPIRLHFSSERVPGRRDKHTLRIPVSGAVPVVGRTGYVYDAVYLQPANFQRAFALVAGSTPVPAVREDMSLTMWQPWESVVGGWNAPAGELAGWQLSVHHQWDARAGTLYLGHGGKSSGSSGEGTLRTVAGSGTSGFSGDGGPATQASLNYSLGVAVGPAGSLYIADRVNHRIRRVGPDGTVSTVAGTGMATFSGDGGSATQASLSYPADVAVGPDGNLHIADTYNHRIRVLKRSTWTATLGEIAIPSEDGAQVYVFDVSGHHLRTLETLTGALRHRFDYDARGRLSSITDGDGLIPVDQDEDRLRTR